MKIHIYWYLCFENSIYCGIYKRTGGIGMNTTILLLIVFLIISLIRQFTYFCATRGLLYYLGTEYGDMPDDKKAKELTQMAMERTIKEFFHLRN